jgi:hypothetical protein
VAGEYCKINGTKKILYWDGNECDEKGNYLKQE